MSSIEAIARWTGERVESAVKSALESAVASAKKKTFSAIQGWTPAIDSRIQAGREILEAPVHISRAEKRHTRTRARLEVETNRLKEVTNRDGEWMKQRLNIIAERGWADARFLFAKSRPTIAQFQHSFTMPFGEVGKLVARAGFDETPRGLSETGTLTADEQKALRAFMDLKENDSRAYWTGKTLGYFAFAYVLINPGTWLGYGGIGAANAAFTAHHRKTHKTPVT